MGCRACPQWCLVTTVTSLSWGLSGCIGCSCSSQNAQQGVPCISAAQRVRGAAIAAVSAGCFVPTYWIILDQWVLPFLHRFQPYPFKLLGLVTPGTWLIWAGQAGRQEITGIFSSSEGFSFWARPLHKPEAFQGLTWTLARLPGDTLDCKALWGDDPFTRGLLCAIPGCGVLSDAVNSSNEPLKTEVRLFHNLQSLETLQEREAGLL